MNNHDLLRTIFCVVCGALLLPLFFTPVLRWLGSISSRNGFRPFAPNWLTAISIAITALGFWAYLSGEVAIGITIVAIGGALDRIDGKMAVAMLQKLSAPTEWIVREVNGVPYVYATITTFQTKKDYIKNRNGTATEQLLGIAPALDRKKLMKRWRWPTWWEMNFAGGTHWGKVFDPMADKLKSDTIIAYFAWGAKLLEPWLVIAMLIPEVFGTLMRRPFAVMEEQTGTSKATGIGKYKALAQWLTIVFCIPFHQGWVREDHWAFGLEWLPDFMLGLTILLAYLSVASKLKVVRKNRDVNGFLEAIEETVDHDD